MTFRSALQAALVRPWLVLTLVGLILLTRTNFSNALIDPPDVTLAAFFVAGLLAPSVWVFALLFAACVGADLAAFQFGISDWCFTPAYVFLVPTYASLWLGGYLLRNTRLFSASGAMRLAGSLAVTTVVAYAISTYSFFLFSGRLVDERSVAAYEASILSSFPYYIGYAALYVGCAYLIALAIHAVAPDALNRKLFNK